MEGRDLLKIELGICNHMINVSVIVPVYNAEKYLKKCVESLVNQTLKDIEFILVNDGSTDYSVRIMEEYATRYPDKITVIQKENGGQADARNFGMQYCNGEYIGFVDADDFVEHDMFELLYNKAKEECYDIVVCDYIKEYTSTQEIVKARQYISRKDMFLGGLAAPWNKIYRREFVIKTKVQFPKVRIYEDTQFFCCLIPHVEKCGYVPKPLVHYVQRKGSTMNSQGDKIATIFTIFDNVMSYYRQNGWHEEYKPELEYFAVRVLFGSSMERICQCNDDRLRKELLYKTWDYSMEHFPKWKKNKYLKPLLEKRNFYMRMICRRDILLLGALLRKYFIYKEKKLQQ